MSYITNDRVVLCGGLGKQHSRKLFLNSLPAIQLDEKMFLVALVMARHSLALARRRNVAHVNGIEYIPAEGIIQEISAFLRSNQIEHRYWEDAIPDDIRRLVNRLRNKIAAALGNRHLIETGKRGLGYRISTHPKMLTILLES